MARTPQSEAKIIETWEVTTPGTVSVFAWDRREDGYIKKVASLSSGSKRITLTRDDRQYNQEQIPEENVALDPFTNGQLRRVDNGPADDLDASNQLTDAQLMTFLVIADQDEFTAKVDAVNSELVLRRLLHAAESDGKIWQIDMIRTLINERYPVGGATRSYREMEEIRSQQRIGS